MKKEKVVLKRCTNYDVSSIEKSIREGIELLGGDSYFRNIVKENSRVLLKPNLLAVEKKGSITVTNYAFFEAVIRIIKDYTPYIKFGDSPGFGDSYKAAKSCGLIEVAEKYGVIFDDFKETVHVSLNDAILCKSWVVAKAPYEADVLITLPKLKTHAMAYFTGAVKNQFGCIQGTMKASWHTRMPDANNFCKMLLDLNSVVNTNFVFMDGITAMQGNGPKSGTPYNLNSILLGSSITAVDSVASRLIGYDDPLKTPVLKEAYDASYGAVLKEDIEILGEKFEDLKAKDFKLVRKGGDFYFLNPKATNFLRGMIAPNPVVITEKCISCGRCGSVCPRKPEVISMISKNGKKVPSWNMQNCIRCFCCQELCPEGAIITKYQPLGKVLGFNRR